MQTRDAIRATHGQMFFACECTRVVRQSTWQLRTWENPESRVAKPNGWAPTDHKESVAARPRITQWRSMGGTIPATAVARAAMIARVGLRGSTVRSPACSHEITASCEPSKFIVVVSVGVHML